MASTMEKVKHALHLDKSSHTTTSGTHEGAAGPHSSSAANAADPRIDSDLDGSRNLGAHSHNNTHNAGVVGTGAHTGTHTGIGGNTTHSGLTGTQGGAGYGSTTGTHNTTTPHSSNVANKIDPRIDSTNTTTGAYGSTGAGTEIGSTNTYGTHQTGGGLTGNTHSAGGLGSNNTYGTHQQTGGLTGNNHSTLGSTGTHGGISNSTNAGPHNSNLANQVDPRVDSDLSGRGNNHSHTLGSGTHATPGSGTAQNTAGPHNSDMMNKLDPRVDADLDGSKTYGGNKTHN